MTQYDETIADFVRGRVRRAREREKDVKTEGIEAIRSMRPPFCDSHMNSQDYRYKKDARSQTYRTSSGFYRHCVFKF